MNLKRTVAFARRRSRGLTLIELMIAMVLGILVSAGIITVFVSTSKSSRAQEQQARLQETGRFAINRLTESLRMASSTSFCSNGGGMASSGGPVLVDGLRTPTILAIGLSFPDNTTAFGTNSGSNTYPAAAPVAPYALPSYFFMRGYDCDEDSCSPMDPDTVVAEIPEMGTDAGKRVKGADVLTLRYLDIGQAWSVGADDSVVATAFNVDSISIVPNGEEPALSVFEVDDMLMYGDCSNAHVFNATLAGGVFTVANTGSAAGQNLDEFSPNKGSASPTWLIDFTKAFKTVTWYLEVVEDGSGATTGALMRRVNGETQEIVRGVERLDFHFGVEDSSGNTLYLTANQVDSGTDCPTQSPNMAAGTDVGCLWRAVKTIQVTLLADGQQALPSLSDNALAYVYSPDGGSILPPDDDSHTIKYSVQGFERGLPRREFNAVVSVRNFNP